MIAPVHKTNLSPFDADAQKIVAKYDDKRAATLTLLHFAQSKIGYVTPEAEEWVSWHADVPIVHVHEVVTFYSMYHQKPAGKHHIRFCTSLSCMLNGSEPLLGHLKNKLGIQNGETSADGRFSLEEAECLCACEHAPMMQVNGPYYMDLTPKKIDEIIEGLK